MTSYEKNLQSAINDTLNQLEAERQKLDTRKNAAQFTLYHAQGTNLTAQDKLDKIKTEYDDANDINIQGVDND